MANHNQLIEEHRKTWHGFVWLIGELAGVNGVRQLAVVAMLPALEKMIGAREARQEGDPARRDDPDVAKSGYKAYQDVLHALRTMLRAGHGEPIVPAMPLADSYPVMIGD